MKKRIAPLKFFNIFDLTVLILLTVIILGTAYYFAVAKLGVSENSDDCVITLSVEMLDDCYLQSISVGDKIYDSISGNELGTVESIEESDCFMPIPYSADNDKTYSVYPGFHNLKIIIKTSGYTLNTKEGNMLIVSGNSNYKNNASVLLRTKNLRFSARIEISVRDKKTKS